jgi:PAS domain-containing protein
MKGHAKQNAFTNQAMQQALKNSQNNVLIWHIKEKYTTQHYGQMLPRDTITDAEWKAHVHPDDLQESLRNLHDLADGKVKSAEFYYRWNYEFDDKKPPRWGYFNNTSVAEYLPGSDKPVSVISTFTDESELRETQREEQMLADKFKLIFEKSIIGMSFYSPDGYLLGANKIMREICHFDNEVNDEFFSQTRIFDLPPFSELINREKPEDFWVCYQSIIPERNLHDYLEIRFHPIRNDAGDIIYLKKKRKCASREFRKNPIHIVEVNQSLFDIAQLYGIRLESLCKLNGWDEPHAVQVGEILRIR